MKVNVNALIKGNSLLYIGIVYSFIISLFVLRNLIFQPGIVEQLDMTWPISDEAKFLPFFAWDFMRSTPQIGIPFGPIYALIILTNVELISKALMILTIFASSISAFYLVYYLNREKEDLYRVIMCFFAATFAVLNPFIFTRFFQLGMLWGFALAPLTLIFFIKGLEKENNWKINMIIAALLMGFSSISVHAGIWNIILVSSFLIFYILTSLNSKAKSTTYHDKRSWKNLFSNFLVYCRSMVKSAWGNIRFLRKPLFFALIYIGLISYWLLPQMLTPKTGHPFFADTIDTVSILSERTSIENVIRLMGTQAYTALDPIGWDLSGPISWLSHLTFAPVVLLIFGILFGILQRPKNKFFLFFLLLIPVGIFLTQGTSSIYLWLMFESPLSGLSWLFRDPSRALCLLYVSFTFLSAYGLGQITELVHYSKLVLSTKKARIQWKNRILNDVIRHRAIILVVIVFSILMITTQPILAGKFSIGAKWGQQDMVPVYVPSAYENLNNWLRNISGDYRVLWLPYEREQLLYTWNYNVTSARPINQFISYVTAKPSLFLFQGAGTDTTRFLSYAYFDNLLQNSTNYGKIMSISNSKYIIYHDDFLLYPGITSYSNDEPPRVLNALNQTTSDLDHVTSFDNFIEVFENTHQTSPLFIPAGLIFLTGGLDGYAFLNSIESFNPEDWGVVYSEQKIPSIQANSSNIDVLMFFNKNFRDLVLSTANQDSFIPLTSANVKYPTEDPYSGWASYGVSPIEFTNIRYRLGEEVSMKLASEFDFNLGSVYTAANNSQLKTSFSIKSAGNYDLWARAIVNGTISLQVNNMTLKTLSTIKNVTNAGFEWINLGRIGNLSEGEYNLQITNKIGNNTINSLLVLPSNGSKNDYNSLQQKIIDEINESNKKLWYFFSDIKVNKTQVYENEIFIPREGNYSLFVRCNPASFSLTIDDSEIVGNSTIYLKQGSHTINLISNNFNGDIGLLSQESTSLDFDQNFSPEYKTYIVDNPQKVDQTSYALSVNATEPFFVVLSESYDSQWILEYDNNRISPFPVYSFLNGFWINKTGAFSISINYAAQDTLEYSMYISCGVLAISVSYLFILGLKRFANRLKHYKSIYNVKINIPKSQIT